MTSGFPHQNPLHTFIQPKVDALPQHGQKADKTCDKPASAPRKIKLRPAH